VSTWLLALSAGALGIFAGAMLTEGGVLVPFWRGLAPADFFAWYAANDRRLLRFFGPPTTVAALLAVLAAAGAFVEGHPGRWCALLAAVLMLGALATFFVYFRAANAAFSARGIAPADLPAALARWAAWHRGRTVVAVLALAAALAALAPPACAPRESARVPAAPAASA
jgi:hypothetical protein